MCDNTFTYNGTAYNLTALILAVPEKDRELMEIVATFTQPDQDLVGFGALVGFIVAGFITQIFSLTLHRLKDCKSHSLRPNGAATTAHITYKIVRFLTPTVVVDPLQFWINIIGALLIGLSDQQLVMGLLVLAIITGTKGASFSMFMAQFISLFTLITHAATFASMRPYFRKYKWMTAIRVSVMLAAYILWLLVNSTIFYYIDAIMNSDLAKDDTSGFVGQELKDTHSAMGSLFGLNCGVMSWVYLSMIPSLFISDELVKVRKAVATWPLRKGAIDDSIIQDWLHRRDIPSRSKTKAVGDILLWPYAMFCRLLVRTKFKPGRTVLWFVAEIFFAWSLIPVALLLLFIILLFLLGYVADSYVSTTEWNFGQVLSIAMLGLPLWAMVQGYAEDWQVAIDEKKEADSAGSAGRQGGHPNEKKEQQHFLSNIISIDTPDGDSIEAQERPRSAIFANLKG